MKLLKLTTMLFLLHYAYSSYHAERIAIQQLKRKIGIRVEQHGLLEGYLGPEARFFSNKVRIVIQITPVSAEVIQAMKRIRSIGVLTIRNSVVADPTHLFQTVAGMKSLHHLSIYNMRNFNDEHLGLLAGLNIKGLILEGTSVSSKGLQVLTNYTELEHLNVSGCRMSLEGVSRIASIKTIAGLELQNAGMTSTMVNGLQKMESLRYLSLDDNPQINDDCVESLGKMTNLEVLSLFNTSTTETGIRQISEALPSTTILSN